MHVSTDAGFELGSRSAQEVLMEKDAFLAGMLLHAASILPSTFNVARAGSRFFCRSSWLADGHQPAPAALR